MRDRLAALLIGRGEAAQCSAKLARLCRSIRNASTGNIAELKDFKPLATGSKADLTVFEPKLFSRHKLEGKNLADRYNTPLRTIAGFTEQYSTRASNSLPLLPELQTSWHAFP